MEPIVRSLIVEDDLTTRTVLTEFLSQFGPCESVEGGGAAIEKFLAALVEGSPFDLVCLDIRMPGVNGLNTLAILRRHEATAHQAVIESGVEPHRARMIMTTSVTSQEAMDKATRRLCDAYLTKPVTLEMLRDTLVGFGLIDE